MAPEKNENMNGGTHSKEKKLTYPKPDHFKKWSDSDSDRAAFKIKEKLKMGAHTSDNTVESVGDRSKIKKITKDKGL